jgi:LuxR family transcriptional regulator, maltose regulon positive regulatory protein
VGAWRTSAGDTEAGADLPRVHVELLHRERVAALLPRPVPDDTPLTVVTAPAGYGKTSALGEHVRSLRAAGHPAAWFSLGPRVRDPDDLWTGLGAALVRALSLVGVPVQRTGPTGAESRQPVPRHPGADSVAEVLTATLSVGGRAEERWSRLADSLDGLGEPLVLVLDDVHLVRDRAVLAALAQVAAHRTDTVHVVWSGRHEPAVGLARRRLLGEVVDIGVAELALTREEVADLLTHDDADPVDPARLQDVWTRTEGWPAAVRLLAGGGDRPGDLQGADPLSAYIEGELLSVLPEATLDVLRSVSVARTVPVELGVRLSGRADAGAALEQVARTLGLVRRTGRDRSVYRLHPALREVLEADLHDRDAQAHRRLHAEAATWAGHAGDHGGAVRHAAAAGDVEAYQRALSRHGLGWILAGGSDELRAVLEAEAPAQRTPEEVVHHALAVLALGDAATGDALLVHLRSLRAAGDWSPRLEDLFQAAVLRRGRYPDVPQAPELPQVLAAMRDPERRERLAIDVTLHVMVDLAGIDANAGDPATAAADLEQARALAELYGYPELALHCLVQLAGIAASTRGIGAARRYAEPAVERAAAVGREDSQALAFAHTVLAWSAHQALDDVGSRAHLDRALAAAGSVVDPGVATAVRCCEAFVAYAAGDRHTALLRLHRAISDFAQGTTNPAVVAHVVPRALRICLAQGEWTWAQECLDLVDQLLPGTGEAALVHAVWSRARHREDLSRRLLADAVRRPLPCVTTDAWVELHLLRAVLLEEVGDRGGSHDALVEALVAAEPDDLVRPFAEAGDRLFPLLVEASGRVGHLEPWRSRVTTLVLAARPSARPGGAELAGLTPREMAVLADLPSLLPLSAIAARHHVSLNTLKTQVKAIYRKLGVSSRHAAVTAARMSGLLHS